MKEEIKYKKLSKPFFSLKFIVFLLKIIWKMILNFFEKEGEGPVRR